MIDFDAAWRHLQQTTKAPDDCQRWNKKAARYDSRDAKNLYAEAFVELAGVQPGETIFDMGCGTGTLAAEMATRGHKVIVGDFSSGMLAKLRENMALRDIKVAESLDALTLGSVFPLRMSWEDDWSQFGLHENMADVAFGIALHRGCRPAKRAAQAFLYRATSLLYHHDHRHIPTRRRPACLPSSALAPSSIAITSTRSACSPKRDSSPKCDTSILLEKIHSNRRTTLSETSRR